MVGILNTIIWHLFDDKVLFICKFDRDNCNQRKRMLVLILA